MVDLDELDRLHAALPELEPQTIYVGRKAVRKTRVVSRTCKQST